MILYLTFTVCLHVYARLKENTSKYYCPVYFQVVGLQVIFISLFINLDIY